MVDWTRDTQERATQIRLEVEEALESVRTALDERGVSRRDAEWQVAIVCYRLAEAVMSDGKHAHVNWRLDDE